MADAKDTRKLERIYTVPLRKAFDYLGTRRTVRAVKLLRAFLARHMKVDEEEVRLSPGVNSTLWRDSIGKPPRRIKVRVTLSDGRVTAWMSGEEEAQKAEAEAKKKAAAEKGKKEAERKKAQKPSETAGKKEGSEGAGKNGGATGAEKKEGAPKPAAGEPAVDPVEKKFSPTLKSEPKASVSPQQQMPPARKQI